MPLTLAAALHSINAVDLALDPGQLDPHLLAPSSYPLFGSTILERLLLQYHICHRVDSGVQVTHPSQVPGLLADREIGNTKLLTDIPQRSFQDKDWVAILRLH